MSAISVGQFEIKVAYRNKQPYWILWQGDKMQAEGGLDFVIKIMFERLTALSAKDIKKAVEQGDSTIKHTLTVR